MQLFTTPISPAPNEAFCKVGTLRRDLAVLSQSDLSTRSRWEIKIKKEPFSSFSIIVFATASNDALHAFQTSFAPSFEDLA